MASFVFHHWQASVQAGATLWGTDTFKAALLRVAPTDPDAATLAALSITEQDGSGYSRWTLGNCTVTDVDAGNYVKLDADDLAGEAIAAGSGNSVGILIYDDTDAGDMPAIWIEFGTAVTHDGTTFSVTWAADGIAKLTC